MPIYEYQCEKCNNVFETIVSLSSQTKPNCKECGSDKVRKLLSSVGIKVADSKSSSPGCVPRGGFS